ncbi:MAG: NAD(P)H-binding protein [Streptosporangiaceae bacterium]|jgi:uncharacterized protein YbjT (DUF2867 family)
MATFLILGGTGKVGRRTARLLEGDGHVVRPIGRSTPLRFDWSDPETWAPAVRGADGMFVVGPGSATDWSPLLTALLETASAAGVRHAVLLSARGVEFLPDGNVARAEEALRTGPLPWTILRPAHFAQNFTEAMFVPVDGRITAPVGDGAEPFIDIEDLAEATAHILATGTATSEPLPLSGPAAITFDQAARILSEATGRHVEFRDQDDADYVADLRAAGTPEEYIRWRMAMLGGIRRGDDAYLSDGIERLLGRPATDFSTWAHREAVPTPAS